MFWLDSKRGNLTDWLTQVWVKVTGRKIEPDIYPWLSGATGPTKTLGLEAFRNYIDSQGYSKIDLQRSKGILPTFDQLTSPKFDTRKIHPSVVHFYENTSDFSIDMSARWCLLFQPGGWLLSSLFSKRLQQLNIPLSNTSDQKITNMIQHWGISESRSVDLVLWLRSFENTGVIAYSGSYSACYLKNTQSNCIKVVFPLPNGRAVVLFRPELTECGGIRLVSSGKKFGDPGFYFVVESEKYHHVKYVQSFQESITVPPEEGGEIFAEHHVNLWGINFLRMYYRMKK